MSESRAKRLLHLSAQGLVIVLSVLVAFVAEDWRSEREERRAMAEALAALTSEVKANAESLDRFVEVVTERHERLVALEPTVDGSRSPTTPSDFVCLAWIGPPGAASVPIRWETAWRRPSFETLSPCTLVTNSLLDWTGR